MLQLNDIKQPMISLKTQNNNHNETIKNVSKQFQQTLPKNYLEPLFYRITKKKASRIVRHAYISYFIRKKNKELQSITKIAFIFFPIFTHLHIFLPDWHKIIESKENAIEKFCFFHHWRNNKKKESEKKNLSDISSLLLSWSCTKKNTSRKWFFMNFGHDFAYSISISVSVIIYLTHEMMKENGEEIPKSCAIPHISLYIRVCLWIQNKCMS